MNKEEIEKAKEDLQFFNEGDYITKEMSESARVLEEYIKELENKKTIFDDDNKRLKEYIEHLEQKLGIKVCDRCGTRIEKNYWTIDIYEKEDNYGMVSAEGVTNNFIENTAKISGIKEEYCVNCIREIKEFIKRKKVEK